MIKLFRNISLSLSKRQAWLVRGVFMAAVAVMSLVPIGAYAEYGASITGASCNPNADPAQDYLKSSNSEKSCVGQGIRMADFKVKVHFSPNRKFGEAVCGLATVNPTCVNNMKSGSTDIEVGVGQSVYAFPSTRTIGGVEVTEGRAEFTAKIMGGDKVCISGKADTVISISNTIHFKAERTDKLNAAYGIDASSLLAGSTYENCIYMPHPAAITRPAVPSFIAPTCINYEASASQFRWPEKDASGAYIKGKTRSFTGVVVQCVEDTLMNLFFTKHGNDTKTVFQKTQDQLKSMVNALLVLYVVFLGMKYGIFEPGSLKQKDFLMIFFKLSFVFYFASGPGLTKLLPGMIGSVKELSAIVIDASAGAPIDHKKTKEELDTAIYNYTAARTAYSQARTSWGRWKPNPPNAVAPASGEDDRVDLNGNTREHYAELMTETKVAMDVANSIYETKRMASVSYGYNYCNFQPFVGLGGDDPTNKYYSSATGDKSFMRLWDGIDCRISKYLGVGADADSPSSPSILLIGIGSIFGGAVGLVVFCLVIIFLIFVILIIVRMVHIYIMAFTAIILLVYIAPLAVPMLLFDYTKSSFDTWIKQLLGFMIQPVILFAFLGFMFAILDSIIYAGNYNFNPVVTNSSVAANPRVIAPSLNHDTIKRVQNTRGYWVCPDENTISCVYEKIGVEVKNVTFKFININKLELKLSDVTIFKYYTLFKKGNRNELNFAPFSNTNPPPAGLTAEGKVSGVGDSDYKLMMMELLKVIFACFVLHALMGQVEELSNKLTNVGAIASLSAAPTADPSKIAHATVVPGLKKAGGAAAWLGGKVAGKVASTASRKVRRG